MHHCGFDSVPSDIGVLHSAYEFKRQHGEAPDDIEMVIEIKGGGAAGGTFATVLDQLENGSEYAKSLKASLASAPPLPSVGATTLSYPLGITWRARAGLYGIPFFMALCNMPVVKRSNGRLGFAPHLTYSERMGFRGLLKAVAYYVAMSIGVLLLAFPPTRWLLKRYYLPAPGEGPDLTNMAKKSYSCTFVATKGEASTVTIMDAQGDPGAYSTTYILAEAAMCLSQDAGSLSSPGGVMTPAGAMGDALMKRMVASGKFKFRSPASAVAAGSVNGSGKDSKL